MLTKQPVFGTTVIRVLNAPPEIYSHNYGVVRYFLDRLGIPNIPTADERYNINIRATHNNNERLIKLPEYPTDKYAFRYVSKDEIVPEPEDSFSLFKGGVLSSLKKILNVKHGK